MGRRSVMADGVFSCFCYFFFRFGQFCAYLRSWHEQHVRWQIWLGSINPLLPHRSERQFNTWARAQTEILFVIYWHIWPLWFACHWVSSPNIRMDPFHTQVNRHLFSGFNRPQTLGTICDVKLFFVLFLCFKFSFSLQASDTFRALLAKLAASAISLNTWLGLNALQTLLLLVACITLTYGQLKLMSQLAAVMKIIDWPCCSPRSLQLRFFYLSSSHF